MSRPKNITAPCRSQFSRDRDAKAERIALRQTSCPSMFPADEREKRSIGDLLLAMAYAGDYDPNPSNFAACTLEGIAQDLDVLTEAVRVPSFRDDVVLPEVLNRLAARARFSAELSHRLVEAAEPEGR